MVGCRNIRRVERPVLRARVRVMWTGRARDEAVWRTQRQETGGGPTHDRETPSEGHVICGLVLRALALLVV